MDARTASAAALNRRSGTFVAVWILSLSTVGIRQTLPYASLRPVRPLWCSGKPKHLAEGTQPLW